jgi:hypothetical protein
MARVASSSVFALALLIGGCSRAGSSGDTPLSWAPDPATQYTLADGTLVTRVGGRTRDRHAREQPTVPGTGDPYDLFAAHYFERRTRASRDRFKALSADDRQSLIDFVNSL